VREHLNQRNRLRTASAAHRTGILKPFKPTAREPEGGEMSKLTASLALAATVALTFTTMATATRPSVETLHIEEEPVLNEFLTDFCGFPVTNTFTGDIRTTTFFNSTGEPVRQQALFTTFVATIDNPENGKTLVDNNASAVITNFEAGTDTIAGTVFNINLPGFGNVVLDAGRLIFDTETGEVLFEAGHHDVVDGTDDPEPICAYLADP
jgi:hypothetical protein